MARQSLANLVSLCCKTYRPSLSVRIGNMAHRQSHCRHCHLHLHLRHLWWQSSAVPYSVHHGPAAEMGRYQCMITGLQTWVLCGWACVWILEQPAVKPVNRCCKVELVLENITYFWWGSRPILECLCMKIEGCWLHRDRTSDGRCYGVVSIRSVGLALIITVFKSVIINVMINPFIEELVLVLMSVMSISMHHFALIHHQLCPQPFDPAHNCEHLLHPCQHLHHLWAAAQGWHIDWGISFSSNTKVEMWAHRLQRPQGQ